MRTHGADKSWIAGLALLPALVVGCSSNHKNAPGDGGMDAGNDTGGQGGQSGKGGSGGKGGAGGSAPISDAGLPMMMMLMCTETPPTTPVMCGGQVCQAPTGFATNPCIIPCCVTQNGKEMCASRSSAMTASTECSLPATPDPQCPDVAGGGTPLKGCCNAQQHKCGIISTLRPGCITQSTLVMLPADPQSCSENDDGGTADAG